MSHPLTRRTKGWTARLGAALVAVCAAALLPAPAARAAAPAESFTWPSSGVLEVAGRGFGHGIGMSQWGARGAAYRGLTHQQILAHYYRGTTLSSREEPNLDVWIQGDTDDTTEVTPAPGLRVSDAAGSTTLPTTLAGAPVTRWRIVRDTTGLRVQGLAGGSWRPEPTRATYTSPATFTTTSGLVRVVLGSSSSAFLREYRGGVRAAASGTSPNLITVVDSTGTDYLRSVVPSEMPALWAEAALRSQAVAARTYAYFEANANAGKAYDTCDTTQCQVFNGVRDLALDGTTVKKTYEHQNTDDAVDGTRDAARNMGQMLTYSGALAFTQFSASNGGLSVAGSKPYLQSFADPYDGVYEDIVPASSPHSWTDVIDRADIQATDPAIGTLLRVTIERDGRGEWGGRTTKVTLDGSQSDLVRTGDQFAAAATLLHRWWAPTSAGWSQYDAIIGPGDFSGDGVADLLARDGAGDLWLQAGAGNGSMAPREQVGTGWGGFTALLGPGDWNGDGRGDVIGRLADGRLFLYPGNGSGGFLRAIQIGTGWQGFDVLLAPGDWNGDRRNDLIARTRDGYLHLYPGNGTGGFLRPSRIGTGWSGFDVILGPGDFSGDRRNDLIARTTDGRLLLYPGNGTGGFLSARQIGTP